MIKHIAVLFALSLLGTGAIAADSTLNLSMNLSRTDNKIFKTRTGANISHFNGRTVAGFGQKLQLVKDLGITDVRTHDIKELDWDIIFPDWNKDPNREASYAFASADSVIQSVVQFGFTPFLRIGISTGAVKNKRKPGIDPPDTDKWKIIAERIVAHYTDGWCHGFNFPIKYVEIWNEPDGSFWTSGVDKFKILSAKAMTYIKQKHPQIKVGTCGISNIVKNQSFAQTLLAYYKDPNSDGKMNDRVPLDFFSWHIYEMQKGADLFAKFARSARSLLDQYGFTNTESICSEWNASLPSAYLNTASAGADVASSLIVAEKLRVNEVLFYPLFDNWGLFNTPELKTASGTTKDIQYSYMSGAFKAFNELRTKTPYIIPCKTDQKGITSLAAASKNNNFFQLLLPVKNNNYNTLNLSLNAQPNSKAQVKVWSINSNGMVSQSNDEISFASNGKAVFRYNIQGPQVYLVTVRFQ